MSGSVVGSLCNFKSRFNFYFRAHCSQFRPIDISSQNQIFIKRRIKLSKNLN